MTATLRRVQANGKTKPPGDSRAAFVRRWRVRKGMGVVLVVVAALLGWERDVVARDRDPVLVVARTVTAGQEITADDLAVVEVALDDKRVASVPASAKGELVGRIATVDLRAGRLLDKDVLVAPDNEPGATVFLPLALKSGQFPPGLERGDRVVLVVTPEDNGIRESETAADSGLAASVVAVDGDRGGFGTGETVVTVSIPRAELGRVAVASGQGRVILAMAAR